MSYLIDDTTLNGTITLSKRTGTVVTLDTSESYVSKDIELSLVAQLATPAFDGGALNNKGATAAFTNMTTSATDTSGVVIQAAGAAGRDAVLYNGDVNGWVTATDNDPVVAAVPAGIWTGTTYYATGVTLTKPSSGTRSFAITVPNGDSSTVTFTFTTDSSGNVTIT